jgi:hypothetical protein
LNVKLVAISNWWFLVLKYLINNWLVGRNINKFFCWHKGEAIFAKLVSLVSLKIKHIVINLAFRNLIEFYFDYIEYVLILCFLTVCK